MCNKKIATYDYTYILVITLRMQKMDSLLQKFNDSGQTLPKNCVRITGGTIFERIGGGQITNLT